MKTSTFLPIAELGTHKPVFVSGLTSTQTGSSTAFSAMNCTGGNFLVVLTSNYTTGRVAISSITDTAGNVWFKAGVSVYGDGNHTAECWCAVDCKSNASNTVTINWASSSTIIHAFLGQFSNVSRMKSCFDGQSTSVVTASGTTHKTNSTTSLSCKNGIIVGIYVLWVGSAYAVTLGDCSNISTNGDWGRGVYKIASSQASQSLTITTANSNHQFASCWAFKALKS